MEQFQDYFAFISYSRHDEEWAKWLAHELEHYHLPLTINGRDDLPHDLRPIFRDIDELSAGNLPQQIHKALENSKHLIVICSPHSAKSPWVNKEIEEFISMGKTDKIYPFIIEGMAMCNNPEDPLECFPMALRNLPKNEERLAANVNENGNGVNKLRTCNDCPIKNEHLKDNKQSDINEKGRDAAVVKIVAGMLGLGFNTLWKRYEKEKAEEEQRIKEQRDNLLRVQSRFLSEKAQSLLSSGDILTARHLAIEALPRLDDPYSRPYVAEAEAALRNSSFFDWYKIPFPTASYRHFRLTKDGKWLIIVSDETLHCYNTITGACILVIENPHETDYDGSFDRQIKNSYFVDAEMSPDGKFIASIHGDSTLRIWRMPDGLPQTKIHVNLGFKNIDRYLDVINEEWDDMIALEFQYPKIQSVRFSYDGNMIAVCAPEFCMIWDVPSFQIKHYLIGKNSCDIEFSPDRNFLATSTCYWDIKTESYHPLPQISLEESYQNPSNMCTFSEDGRFFASVTNFCHLNIFEVCSWKIIFEKENPYPIEQLCFFSNKETIILKTNNTIVTLDLHNNGEEKQCQSANDLLSLYYFNDGKLIVSELCDKSLLIKQYHNYTSAQAITPIAGYFMNPFIVIENEGFQLFDPKNGKELFILKVDKSVENSFTLSDNGKYAFCLGGSTEIIIWELEIEKQQKKEKHTILMPTRQFIAFNNHNLGSSSAGYAISNNGMIIVTSGHGLSFMDLEEDFIYTKVFDKPEIENAYWLDDFSPANGSYWDENDQCFHMYTYHPAFSPDDKLLAAYCSDKYVRIWEYKKKQCIKRLRTEKDLNYLKFSKTGQHLIATDTDGNILIWETVDYNLVMNTNVLSSKDFGVNKDSLKAILIDNDTKIVLIGSYAETRASSYFSAIIDFPPLRVLIKQYDELRNDVIFTEQLRKKYMIS